MSELDKKVGEYYERLPKALQEMLSSVGLRRHLRRAAQENNLGAKESKEMENEVALVLLGVNPLQDFPKNIAKVLTELPSNRIDKLLMDINENIFTPVRSSLETLAPRAPANTPAQKVPERSNKEEIRNSTHDRARPEGPWAKELNVPKNIVETKLGKSITVPRERGFVDPYRESPE